MNATPYFNTQSLGEVQVIKRNDVSIVVGDKQQQTTVDNIPVYADSSNAYTDPSDIPTSAVGHCERYCLSKEEDRTAYADVITQLSNSLNIELIFEERVTSDNGELIIYLSYIEYIKVAQR